MGCGASSKLNTYDAYEEQLKAGVLPSEQALDAQNVFDRFVFQRGAPGTVIKSGAAEPAVFPTFHGAACWHPVDRECEGVQHFLLLGVHSRFDGQTGFRGPMRAVFVLDTSGSMGQYYDVQGSLRTRLELAKETLLRICEKHLREGDEMGVVTCAEAPAVLRELSPWLPDGGGLAALREALAAVHAVGGSNLKSGVTTGYSQASRPPSAWGEQVAGAGAAAADAPAAPAAQAATRRLFVLTDFASNLGENDKFLFPGSLATAAADLDPGLATTEQADWESDVEDCRDRHPKDKRYGVMQAVQAMANGPRSGDAGRPATPPVYTSFLFVGLALKRSGDVRKKIDCVIGCNAVTVVADPKAQERFDESFECMVTPVARKLRLELQGSTFQDIVRCGNGGAEKNGLLKGDGEFFSERSIFPQPPTAGSAEVRGGVMLFKLSPLVFREGQQPVAGATTTIAMRIEMSDGEEQVTHYTVDLPCFHPKLGNGKDLWPKDFQDVFQSKSVQKAVALWHYAQFSKNLLRAWRRSSSLVKDIAAFKEYFEGAARSIGDDAMPKEVELWDQLVEVKNEDFKARKKSSCCSIL